MNEGRIKQTKGEGQGEEKKRLHRYRIKRIPHEASYFI